MIIINEKLLEYFRRFPFCEMCETPSPGRLDPHHVMGRGMAGGWRLDVSIGLVALCPAFWGKNCHTLKGDDPGFLDDFLGIVATREGLEGPEVVREAIWRLRRRPGKVVI